jgi:tetratricopeptide (TPR) repeat protein
VKPIHYILICCLLLGLSLGGYSQKTSQDYVDKGNGIISGWFYMNPNRPIKLFTKAIKLDSTNSKAYYSRGKVYYHQKQNKALADKDFNQALSLCNKMISEASTDSLICAGGIIKHHLGLKDDACADFTSTGDYGKLIYKRYCVDKKD